MSKRSFRNTLFSLASAAAITVSSPVFAQDAAPSNFQATMSRIDQNGIAMSYLDTSEVFDACRKILQAFIAPLTVDNADAKALADIGASLWKQSGIGEIRGIGRSCKKDGEFYTSKQFIYAPAPARNNGFFWQLVPSTPGLVMAELAFSDCKLAVASNFDGAALWNTIDRNLKAYASPDVREQTAAMLAQANLQGFDVPQLMSSVSAFGFFMNGPMSFTLAFKTKSPVLFNTCTEFIKKQGAEFVKNNEIVFPIGTFVLTVFQRNDLLIVTNDAINIKARLEGRKLALSEDPTFRKYSAGLTANTGSWGYIAPGFCSQLIPLVLMLPQIDKQTFNPQTIQNIVNSADLDQPLFSASMNTHDGSLTITRTGSRPVALLLSSPECQSALTSFVPAIAALVPGLASYCFEDMDCEDEEDDDDAVPAEKKPQNKVQPAPAGKKSDSKAPAPKEKK